MAAPFLIIDGYNLMHAAGMARADYGPGQFEKQRTRFIAYLVRQIPAEHRSRTTVVFDAQDAPHGLPRRSTIEEIEILFAKPGEDADSLIEELIAHHSAPKQVLLVSSDHRLQKAARRRRARFADSEGFLERFAHEVARKKRRIQQESPPPEKIAGAPGPLEVAAWLEEFGAIPEADRLDPKLDPNEVEFWAGRIQELDDEEDDRARG